jgi:hypothetical protein
VKLLHYSTVGGCWALAAINFAMLFTDAATWLNVIAVLASSASGTLALIVASRQPETCHVCGHRGMVRQMTKRGGHRVCRNVPACTERVMNPPPVRAPAITLVKPDLSSQMITFYGSALAKHMGKAQQTQ